MSLPDLTFPTTIYGRNSTPMDLRVLVYKGSATQIIRTVFNRISRGEFGNPLQECVELAQLIHEEMNAGLIGGGSQETAIQVFNSFRSFFGWMDKQNAEVSLKTIETKYRQWADYIYARVIQKEITHTTAYSNAYNVSKILSKILEKTRPLITTTRIQYSSKQWKNIYSDSQNLGDVFVFGHFLIDLANCLNLKAIYGPLPVEIKLRNGTAWDEWSGLPAPIKVECISPEVKKPNWQTKKTAANRSAYGSDRTLRTRYPLVNLRLEAELLIFLAQTSMNLAQAHKLKLAQFSYKSNIDGYQVLDYKNRRKGEVLFEVFSEYRHHFEQYLSWRKSIFGDKTDLLFPSICHLGRAPSTPPQFARIIKICKKIGIQYYGPRQLRKTRINWLLRQTRNPELTAEQAQHTRQVLHRNYEQPSLQVAKVEITRFWKKKDPTLQNVGPAPAPGVCNGIPKALVKPSRDAPKPDCVNPSGCLFCEHHRDIDSEDYVWSIASMKYFHTSAITNYRPVEKNSFNARSQIEIVIEILVAKLRWFKNSNEKREKWVVEALDRCSEENFHPHWAYLIDSVRI